MAQPKIKIYLWYFARVLFVLIILIILIILILVLDILKILDFMGNYFIKIVILSFGDLLSKIRDSHFVKRLFYVVCPFLIACYFRTLHHSSRFKTYAIFHPKCQCMTSLKPHFLKKYRRIFWNLRNTPNWCWRRHWKYIVDIYRPFWAIDKFRQGPESDLPHPPAGRRLLPLAFVP